MTDRATLDLQAAAVAVEKARGELIDAMRRARAAGLTLRQIGDITGLSHETVRRFLASS